MPLRRFSSQLSVLLPPSQLSGHFNVKGAMLCNRACLFVMTSVVASLRRLTRLTESEQCCQKMINKQCLLTEKKLYFRILTVDVNGKVPIHFCKAFIS